MQPLPSGAVLQQHKGAQMKIEFEFDSKYGLYKDALHLPDDHGLSDADIESMKQQRLNNWIAVLEAPPVEQPIEETPPVEEPAAGE